MSVVDASIVVRLLLNRHDDAPLRERFGDLRRIDAPSLIDAEVVAAVRGLLITSKPTIAIGFERATQMLDDFADLPLVRHPVQPLHTRVLELRDNFTAYDACYIALAEALSLRLLTCDSKFAAAPTTHHCTIETWT